MFSLINFFKAIAEYFSKPKTTTTHTENTSVTNTQTTTTSGTNPYTPPVPPVPNTGNENLNTPPAQTFPPTSVNTENTEDVELAQPIKTDYRLELLKDIESFAKDMLGKKARNVLEIAVHCSATKEGRDYTVADIDKWHKQAGFTKQKISGHYCGYHYVVALDGTIMKGRDLREVGAHASGHNSNSIGVCYIGGLDNNGKSKDTRTPEQKESLLWLIANLKRYLNIKKVLGHRDYPNVAKDCPCFNAIPEYQNV